jgi:hypothetical protein
VIETCLLWLNLCADLLHFLLLGLRSKSSLAAENLFLRKALAFYKERGIKPRRISHPTRFTLIWLSRWFDWRGALTVVTPRTFIGWNRQGFRFTGAGSTKLADRPDSAGAPTFDSPDGARESLVG